MIKFPELMIAWMRSAIGKNLLSVAALFYVSNSERDSSPLEVGLLFDNLRFGKFYGDNDGATLCFSLSSLVECDLGEYGKKSVFCISKENPFSNVVGRKLISPMLAISNVENTIVGAYLLFDNNKSISILNLGDEIFIYGEIPDGIIKSEGLNLFPVLGENSL